MTMPEKGHWPVLRKRYGDRIDDCSDLYAGCKDLNEYLESNFPPEQ